MARIHLTQLKLTDFRNYASLRLDCDRRHVVLTGDNGAGKTNLLEAISFLSPGRGLRRALLDQVARSGSSGAWSVHAEMEGAAGPVSIGTGVVESALGPEARRRVRINGAAARSADDLLEHCRIVWLTPAMDGLFTGPAARPAQVPRPAGAGDRSGSRPAGGGFRKGHARAQPAAVRAKSRWGLARRDRGADGGHRHCRRAGAA